MAIKQVVWLIAISMAMAITAGHAQPQQSGPAAPMQEHNPSMMGDDQHMHAMPGAPQAGDSRQLVSLPAPMQEHMLANMRDHLQTLNTVFGDIADGKFDAASKVLEERLGMSSLPLHQATEMAPFFPQPMQDAGTSMHHAASRLAIALQDASVTQTFDSMRAVNSGVHEVTASCVACHTAYRIR